MNIDVATLLFLLARSVMFQIIIRTVYLTFFITVLAIALGVQKCCCAGSLVTTPPAVDGVLTSCGETRLTCSHDNVAGEQTRWRITTMDSLVVCEVIINHFNPFPHHCNEFSFEDITAFPGAVDDLNSTAVVNPLPLDLSGSLMECIAGGLSTSSSVGSVTLCVIGECT